MATTRRESVPAQGVVARGADGIWCSDASRGYTLVHGAKKTVCEHASVDVNAMEVLEGSCMVVGGVLSMKMETEMNET